MRLAQVERYAAIIEKWIADLPLLGEPVDPQTRLTRSEETYLSSGAWYGAERKMP